MSTYIRLKSENFIIYFFIHLHLTIRTYSYYLLGHLIINETIGIVCISKMEY